MRPMLASTPTPEVLERHLSETYLFASAKLDGIRALTTENGLVSRSLKPIRNAYIQGMLADLPPGLDGELVVGSPMAKDVFNKTTSGVMSRGGEPTFAYCAFDFWNTDDTYAVRFTNLQYLMHPCLMILPQITITNMDVLEGTEHGMLDLGYEGMIVRRPDAPYKFNRATNREGYLMKVKRFVDSEATIIKVNQKFHNANVAETNELGLTSRSSSKENKVPLEQVGSFMVRDLEEGWVFEVHGFSHTDAATWWATRDELLGKIITYKYLAVGMKDVPRHPIFKGFRDPLDLERGE
ncbi:hypothetical protein LCGC14_2826900 [marine sediment metagenome]|uniref:ATP-dependent DNA ligase family profile domain-containing protein n=1 Tax=marine sediment metagenome TaxID=412755 RepID=A0A0F8YF78_9ZZZZ